MNPSGRFTRLAEPGACTDQERTAFARLVREGFGSDAATLPGRIRAARWLAFRYAGETPVGIAALKAPPASYRDGVFRNAGAGVDGAAYVLELGWVWVAPGARRKGIAADLCRHLLARVPATAVFATTRPDNTPMIRILEALDFGRVGHPYARRDERLSLFLRPRPG